MKPWAISCLALLTAMVLLCGPARISAEQNFALELHISPAGNDRNPGTAANPFLTLERARTEIRAIKQRMGLPVGGIAVVLHKGVYELPQTFALTAEDAGTAEAPIVYCGRPGEEVRISGGRTVLEWQAVTDAAVLEQLDPDARRHVIQTDLKAQGVKHFETRNGGFGIQGGPGLELFFDDQPMTLSRFPNEGFIKIGNVEGPTEIEWNGHKGRVEPIFTYLSERPDRWAGEDHGWVHGFWFHDWADERLPIASIDTSQKRMTLKGPRHHYGYRSGQWFYGFNLLCEIDQPGEWYLNRQTGVLYFWPPKPMTASRATVSVLSHLVTMTAASHVTLRGLILEASRDTAVTMEDASHNEVMECTIRNTGGWAVKISGENSGVVDCTITATAEGGVELQGGNRTTLAPAKLYAENNHIYRCSRWKRMNGPALHVLGVGNRVTNNLLHDLPHVAIMFSGNDHMIELNEIHHVCQEANDGGAIYAGRDWTMRGTVIRHNYLHHIRGFENRGCVGVYLDDMYSGTTIFGNVFHEVTNAAFIGGGHDNTIENNIFIDCRPAVHVDSRGLGWARMLPEGWGQESAQKGTISGIEYRKPPYSNRYPLLTTILEREPGAPTGSVIVRNVYHGGEWKDIDESSLKYVRLEDNRMVEQGQFTDFRNRDFQLSDSGPADTAGFRRIPFDKIGRKLAK